MMKRAAPGVLRTCKSRIANKILARRITSLPSTIVLSAPDSAGQPSPARTVSLTHYFDTFHVVTRLESAGFEHGQAVATMKAIRALLVNSTEIAKAEMLSKADLENVWTLY